MNRKPRILLIPNLAWWVIGEMGKQIIARFGDKYDFYFFPEGLLERRPELLRAMLSAVDVVHCLNESSLELFTNVTGDDVPPIATWIHHVTSWSPMHQMAVDRSSVITVCTRGWKQEIERRVGGNLSVTTVPHGVDSQFFQRRKVRPERFGIPPGRFVLGFVGAKASDSDRGRKGTDVFLDLVRKASARLPNLHVLLAGPGWESELKGLRSQGISASATGYVRKSDLPSVYSALDVYLLTSRVEGGPCTVFEAMACQTAVVSTRVGAVPELIMDGVNGYSAEIDDADSLLSAILTLGESPEKRLEIGRKARETVRTRSWSQALSPLENVYDELIALRRTRAMPAPGPDWMADPDSLLAVTCAADALGYVIPRIRKRSMTAGRGLRLLIEMLDKQSLLHLVTGAAVLRGTALRTTRS
jgi:glycosyltransferase involved in cell wall biosynthesis